MKFSIVTPAYNAERFIREAMESVLSQEGNFEIEYLVMDGVSTDGTVTIAHELARRVTQGTYPIRCAGITLSVHSGKDGGMYDAINKGFAQASGDIYAWLNADDRYESDAFARIAEAFQRYPDIRWLKGISTPIEEDGSQARGGRSLVYRQDWLALGAYGREAPFVEQDSVFWRKELWQKGGPIPEQYRLAGDYWLWMSFAKYAKLWSVDAQVSNFRKTKGQLSSQARAYRSEQLAARPRRPLAAWSARLFFSPQSRLAPHFQKFFLWLYPLCFGHEQYVDRHLRIRAARSYLS